MAAPGIIRDVHSIPVQPRSPCISTDSSVSSESGSSQSSTNTVSSVATVPDAIRANIANIMEGVTHDPSSVPTKLISHHPGSEFGVPNKEDFVKLRQLGVDPGKSSTVEMVKNGVGEVQATGVVFDETSTKVSKVPNKGATVYTSKAIYIDTFKNKGFYNARVDPLGNNEVWIKGAVRSDLHPHCAQKSRVIADVVAGVVKGGGTIGRTQSTTTPGVGMSSQQPK
jgi:hypothetical protein